MAVDAAPATVKGQQARQRLPGCAALAAIRTSGGFESEPTARGADVVPSVICRPRPQKEAAT